MGKGEIHSASGAKQIMANLNRDEVYRKMNEFHELPAFQQQGIARLQEIDREEDDARHQEAKSMHAASMAEARGMHEEVMAETRKMHGQLHSLERWGFWVAVALGLVALLDFFGFSPKSKSEAAPHSETKVEALPKLLDDAKSQEPATKVAQEPKAPLETPPLEAAKTPEGPKPKGQ